MPERADPTKVVLVPHDPAWADTFGTLSAAIRGALGGGARAVSHIGSTAVSGLVAKPIIDIALVVDDSADEAAYAEALINLGYRLVVREPEWFEHRLFQRDLPAVNLHVYSIGCAEVERVLRFRDWLRTHEEDRDLYASTKQGLARRKWANVQEYADAKDPVVAEIMVRADRPPGAH